MYQRNKPNAVVSNPVDQKMLNKKRDDALKIYQEKARLLTEEVRTLEGKKHGLENTLKASYAEHQLKVDALYDAFKEKVSKFEEGCHTRELNIIEKQRRVDTEQANLETQRITISDASVDLIDKENRLIEFGNDLNAQQQILDNDRIYLNSLEESTRVTRVELDLLKQEANEAAKRSQERKLQILKMEADLNAKIKEHDLKLSEVVAEEEKFKKIIEEYKKAHASILISQAERRDFDREVQKNVDYATQLKTTGEYIQDQEQKLEISKTALRVMDREIKQRMEQVKILERTYTKGGSRG